jgi:adenine-specific DNA methylase
MQAKKQHSKFPLFIPANKKFELKRKLFSFYVVFGNSKTAHKNENEITFFFNNCTREQKDVGTKQRML